MNAAVHGRVGQAVVLEVSNYEFHVCCIHYVSLMEKYLTKLFSHFVQCPDDFIPLVLACFIYVPYISSMHKFNNFKQAVGPGDLQAFSTSAVKL